MYIQIIFRVFMILHNILFAAPEYHYRVCVYSPLSFTPPNCCILFSVSLYHEMYTEVSQLVLTNNYYALHTIMSLTFFLYNGLQRLQRYVDTNFSRSNLIKTNDIICSIHGDVKLVPPAAAEIPHYTITSNPESAIVS